MFEAIAFRASSSHKRLLDAGAIAEALIFYGQVSVLGNTGVLQELLRIIPPFVLLRLLRDKRLRYYYLEDQLGVSSSQAWPGVKHHALLGFSSPDHTIEKVAASSFRRAAGDTGQAKIGSSQFERVLLTANHQGFDTQAVFAELSDQKATSEAVAAIVSLVSPEYRQEEPIRFRVEGTVDQFFVDTNLVFDRLNAEYHKLVPSSHSSIDAAYLIAKLQTIHEGLYFAALLNTEVAAEAYEWRVNGAKLDRAMQMHAASVREIATFSDLVLNDSRSIRNAVNSGKVEIVEVVKLVDKADKFRGWLQGYPAQSDLLREYYKKTVEKTWAEKLPFKTTRWAMFTVGGMLLDAAIGGGGIATTAGLALSASDAFLFDRLVSGWKPHHFIEDELKPALMSKDLGDES